MENLMKSGLFGPKCGQEALQVTEGMTPLLCAVFRGDVDIVRLLIASLSRT